MSQVEGTASAPEQPAYRCFLFADLRGYTAFIESAGNKAGVELLDVYLSIVRSAVAAHHGAEIKVEGDGFHAVFPSASAAVMCAVAIAKAAAEATRANPQQPINVGIGIHAGEAVETRDGFIGSAVNIASRVCDSAASGEVLVTGTVRGITQASIPVRFASRGRRRLKGIAEPVELYAIVSEAAAPSRGPRMPQRRWLAAATVVGALAIGVLALAFLLRPGDAPPPSISPMRTTASNPLAVGELAIGSYRADQFRRPFRFLIGDLGWTLYRYTPDAVGLLRHAPPTGRLDVTRIEQLYANACFPEEESVPIGPTPTDLVEALGSITFLETGEPTLVFVGGRPGIEIDVTISEAAQAACGSIGGSGIALLSVGGEPWRAEAGERVRIVALDLDGSTVSFLVSLDASPADSVSELFEFLEQADRVIRSIVF